MKVVFLLLVLSVGYSVEAMRWKLGDNGQVKWSKHCNYDGNEIGSAQITSQECSSACLATENCHSFAWNRSDGGTCRFKDGSNAHRDFDTLICSKVIKHNKVQ